MASSRVPACFALRTPAALLLTGFLCVAPATVDAEPMSPATQPATTRPHSPEDATRAKPIQGRDWLERFALERGLDFKLMDRLLDARTVAPSFDRQPPGSRPAESLIADGVPVLDDTMPFSDSALLPVKKPDLWIGAAKSTYRTRERAEVQGAMQPLIELVQREVEVRFDVKLYDHPQDLYLGLVQGQVQMAISNVLDYLLVREWLSRTQGNGIVPLDRAIPGAGRTASAGIGSAQAGSSVELIVRADASWKVFADLRGKRLALTANYINAPGTFLTQLLVDGHFNLNQPFFGAVTLRRYAKDAVLDVYKGRADAACADHGTIEAVCDLYGIGRELRALAVSPGYNFDVMYSTANNVATHNTEIELTRSQVITMGKNPEGQEILYLFDTKEWRISQPEDFNEPQKAFGYYATFLGQTPVDLKPLLDSAAAVDRRTYGKYGDE